MNKLAILQSLFDIANWVILIGWFAFLCWVSFNMEQKRPAPMTPAPDADEEADMLPFGPTPPTID